MSSSKWMRCSLTCTAVLCSTVNLSAFVFSVSPADDRTTERPSFCLSWLIVRVLMHDIMWHIQPMMLFNLNGQRRWLSYQVQTPRGSCRSLLEVNAASFSQCFRDHRSHNTCHTSTDLLNTCFWLAQVWKHPNHTLKHDKHLEVLDCRLKKKTNSDLRC